MTMEKINKYVARVSRVLCASHESCVFVTNECGRDVMRYLDCDDDRKKKEKHVTY